MRSKERVAKEEGEKKEYSYSPILSYSALCCGLMILCYLSLVFKQ